MFACAGPATHFVGYHGKTTPGFARAGGFDGGVERQQVGLLGNGTDHFQHRTDLPAAAFQRARLVHGGVHAGSQAVDATAGAVDQLQAFAAGWSAARAALGRLRGVMGDIRGGGAHLVGSGGHLFDFTVLLLHAVAGLAGDGGRLVGGTTCFLQ